ncbi:ATP-binding protein [Mucilaginibacter polytrichastri]|uniref:Histidine kinase/HSP90-like ATPase domain-containing protein n=1 Tax=Mucilaginibacter polytrichastri TaxID=1302689 RepID=A0A1Q6A5E8_9SPHI|nr:ATP-binding protein [Mucilaginibacter polytrichastri]OKS89234.1 hypothetical protein RG47T_4717 [Mucilaginibacter polytrichastri]SFS98400.1 Histidine kinase-, DNA gyrase B-, and HSP90-like ATPase [Mucilaginibacter polytrichastri]
MAEANNKIPFSIEISRVIEVLASQIYPTPFALLRENVQNSYDAILLRKYLGQSFDAQIDITIEPGKITVRDNGIGMSSEDLRNHFWRAGSSSKNTKEAQAAGVVGTFGIGAMANFGIAEDLIVESESAKNGERTSCSASRSTLSVTEDCIVFENIPTTGNPGTFITAVIQPDKFINVQEAVTYISQFVGHLTINVNLNGINVSQRPIENSIPTFPLTWEFKENNVDLGEGFYASIQLTGAFNGDIRIVVTNIIYGSQQLEGKMVLRQGQSSLQTLRSGFGLAVTAVSSSYQLGGIADFLFLQPTAGREALTTDSVNLLQRIVTLLDRLISLKIGNRPESNSNSYFVSWAAQHQRFDLCSYLQARIEPGNSIALRDLVTRSKISPLLVYHGTDNATIQHASEDRPIIMISRNYPRRDCELGYLRQFCNIEELSDEPKVIKLIPNNDLSISQSALAFRIASVLSVDYFLEADIKFGVITHGLPILVTNQSVPIEICLDPNGSSVQLILGIFENEYNAFGHMVKDFVRNVIFPRVADLVPSSTRQGAEAFLKTINRTREIFEYDNEDLDSLTSIWQDYLIGRVSFQQASDRAGKALVKSSQILDFSATAHVRDIVPDVLENEIIIGQKEDANFGPLPAIQRLDVSTERKVLTIDINEQPLKGYRCFLAITDKIKNERGDFFLQPHRTSIVWGGQKALFIFEHHSGQFGLYYDLQTQNLISDGSGGGTFETCTIIMKNRIFIPIPPAIEQSFLPQPNERKRFEVKCDILYIDKNN